MWGQKSAVPRHRARSPEQEDRYHGLLCRQAVFNHPLKHELLTDLAWLKQEGRFIGFNGKPPSYEQVVRGCSGSGEAVATRRALLNFDDAAWGRGLERFLGEQFGEKSKFEK